VEIYPLHPWRQKLFTKLFGGIKMGAPFDAWIDRACTIRPKTRFSPWYEVNSPDLDPFS
jgi:hypothetical protein